jgi:vacuolar-type H+-ATPase subunit H
LSQDENLIRQVIEMEKQARAIDDAAVREAEGIPAQAQKDAEALLLKSRADAQDEAKQIIAGAQAKEESAKVAAKTEAEAQHMEATAKDHFDQAVNYVLDQLVGR